MKKLYMKPHEEAVIVGLPLFLWFGIPSIPITVTVFI